MWKVSLSISGLTSSDLGARAGADRAIRWLWKTLKLVPGRRAGGTGPFRAQEAFEMQSWLVAGVVKRSSPVGDEGAARGGPTWSASLRAVDITRGEVLAIAPVGWSGHECVGGEPSDPSPSAELS